MTVRVTPVGTTGDVFAVHAAPHWLARLLGVDERDFYAVRVRSYLGGHDWIDDKTGRRVASSRVRRALDAARRRPHAVPFRTTP